MLPSTRFFIVAFLGSLALLVVGNLASQFLPPLKPGDDATRRVAGPIILGFYLLLAGILMFSAVPVVIRFFLSAAARLTHGAGAGWLRTLGDMAARSVFQDKVVLAAWTIMAAGLAIAVALRART